MRNYNSLIGLEVGRRGYNGKWSEFGPGGKTITDLEQNL
jgi:hypothetical protein